MRYRLMVVLSLAMALHATADRAGAQRYYPRGYGAYGMAGWGGDPAAAFMTGLGSYARSAGVYQLDRAKANAINTDTAIKWNKALRERQRALREEQKKRSAEQEKERRQQESRTRLESGAALNDLLDQIFDADPGVAKVGRSSAPISPAAIREIPFEWNSEALSACLDELTSTGSAIPDILSGPKYVQERNAVRSAVARAFEEDSHGEVSLETRKTIHDAVSHLRAKFLKEEAEYNPGYHEGLNYLTTLAAVNRMLNDPSMKQLLAELQQGKERTVGDLITFMNAYNLRFGPAESDRQREIYARLEPTLVAIRDEISPGAAQAPQLDRSGANLRSAAKSAFRGMNWSDIEAHSKAQ